MNTVVERTWRRLSSCGRMNHVVGTERPGAITLAEESTAFPGVSRPPSPDLQSGGLGFHYKWNMGWMHDTLEYASMDAVHRKYHQNQTHLRVDVRVHRELRAALCHTTKWCMARRRCSARCPVTTGKSLPICVRLYGFMWAYPGKKLLFMGCELAQPTEWADGSQLPWHLEQQAPHQGVQRLVRDLNRVYRAFPALHEQDVQSEGFEWIAHDDSAQSVIAFQRRAQDGRAVLWWSVTSHLCLDPGTASAYQWQGPGAKSSTPTTVCIGGSSLSSGARSTEPVAAHAAWVQSLVITLPPLACLVLIPGEA